MSLTHQVREELAHLPLGRGCCRRAETAAALRFGATFRRRGGEQRGFGVVVRSSSGAVIRRLCASLRDLEGLRPEIAVLEPGGLRRALAYQLSVPPSARAALLALGVLDGAGRPQAQLPAAFVRRGCDRDAYVRGVLLVTGSLSDPRRSPHLELAAPDERLAHALTALLRDSGAASARVARHRDGWRVVVKSGAQVAAVLAHTGAHTAFLAFDDGRLRRELRGAANRAANADRANLQRSVSASGRQVEAIEHAVERLGWEGLPEDLREIALVRLANPEASLSELGDLLEPAVGKTAVHRRLGRLVDLAEEP